jgi:hypothetical protein
MGAKGYTVVGEYITVRTATADGYRIVGLYKGAPLPGDVSPEAVAHHLRQGLIAEVGEAEEQLAAEPGEVPGPFGSEPAPGSSVEPPAGNAARSEWAVFAESKGAPASETGEDGLTRDELRAKYGA